MVVPPTHLPGSNRLRGIDALRGAAALGVVLYHAVEQGDKVLPNNLFQYPIRAGPIRELVWLHRRLSLLRDLRLLYSPAMGQGPGRWREA